MSELEDWFLINSDDRKCLYAVIARLRTQCELTMEVSVWRDAERVVLCLWVDEDRLEVTYDRRSDGRVTYSGIWLSTFSPALSELHWSLSKDTSLSDCIYLWQIPDIEIDERDEKRVMKLALEEDLPQAVEIILSLWKTGNPC